jgi:3-isopropylmalate/(R)-2-methylmalate dehydratase small subunit
MTDLATRLRGRVWKLGDSVDTTQLAGGGLAGKDARDTLRINCLRGIRPDFTASVRPGDLIVAGSNFGCGSSRQTAVEAMRICGVAAVLAESVARIHRRNAIAMAFPMFVVPGISHFADDDDILEVDYPGRVVRNLGQEGALLHLSALPVSVETIYAAGGILEVIRQRLADRGIVPTPAIAEPIPTT